MAGKKTNIKNTPPVSPHPDWDAVFQIIHEPAMIVSPDFNILHANLATQKAFGLSEQQLQGRHCYEIFHGTKTAPPGCPLAKLMITGRAQTSELEVEMLHGNYRVSCTPIFDENGKIKSIFHLASDVTERMQAEQVLRQHALQNSTILETALDGFWLVESNTQRIVDVNEAYCRMSGYSRDEILTMTIPQLEALEQTDEVNAHVARVMDKKADRFETVHRRKDGSKFFVDVSVQYLVETGKLFAFLRDITERKQAEEALKASTQFANNLIASMQDGISVLDKNGVHLDVNLALCHMTGYSREELIGSKTPHPYWPTEEYEHIESAFQKTLTSEAVNFELTFKRKNGERFPVLVSPFAIRDGLGNIVSYSATVKDITERKQAEERLQEKQTQLQAILDYSPALISIKDLNGNIVLANRSFAVLDAPPLNEFVGRNVFEVFSAEVAEKLWENDLAALHAGVPVYSEEVVGHKDGSLHIYFTVKFPIYLRSDQPFGICAISNDITERMQTENALRESEEKFKYLFDNSTVGKSLTLISGEMTANKTLCDMFGYTEAEFQNKKWQEITHPEDIELTQREIEKLFSGEQNLARFVKRYIHKNGSVVWVDLSSSLRRDQDGKPLYLMTSVIDITKRVHAEEEIKKLARHYQALIEKAPDGIVLLNEQGNFKFVSPSAKKMFGFSVSEEMTGNPVQYTHPDDLPLVLSELGRLLEDLSYVPTLQYRFSDKNGNWKWVESTFSNLLADPSVESIVINFRDITERKLAEEELTNSEVRYRRLFEAARDGILILDAESGVITDVNPFLIEMLSFSKEEICGKELWELGFFKDIAASRANFQELQQKEYIRYEDLPLETSKGRKFRVEFISNVYRVNHHKVIQCNVRDITERVQAEEKIRQLNAELEQRVEDRTRELRDAQEKLVRHEKLVVLGQMSSSVGHELRNPLSVINSAIYYLKMIQPNAADDVKEYLGIIDQEVRTAEKIITDLLDFSRIKSVDREAVSVSELIRRTLERFPVPESVAVTIEVPSDLPQVFVDVHHMTQVLGNLTVNACQAMTSSNERTLIVGQLSLYSTVQNDMINITVKDNGVGISAENMKKIFEPLFTTKTKGIGLGLAVSQKLVAANEGRIEVESEAGKGTSFHVYLPIYGAVPVIARDKKESE